MQKRSDWFRRSIRRLREAATRRLVNKLILLFSTILILVVMSLTLISYRIIEKESVQHSISSNSNNLLLVNKNFEKYFGEIEQLSLPKSRYDDIVSSIIHERTDYGSQQYLQNYLWELFYSRSDLDEIALYLIDEGKYYYIRRENFNVPIRTVADDTIPKQAWYQSVMRSEKNAELQSLVLGAETGYPSVSSDSFMAYHRVIRSLADRKARAVLSFFFNDSEKTNILKDIPFNEGEHVLFLNANGVPFHVDDPDFYERSAATAEFMDKLGSGADKSRFTWKEGRTSYLVMDNTSEDGGWKLVKAVPYSQIYETAQQTRRLGLLIGLGFLAVAIVLTTLTSNAITRPLKRLSTQMRRFSGGEFDSVVEVKGRDEIAYLSRHFNLMVSRTNELINERYKMKLVEKNAILKALEAEINPHFLYNALQAISTKALKGGMDEIADMVDALALTLRYCISGKDIVQARDELRHIERYMVLQKARFGERLIIKYEIEESLMQLPIPKLSIQSLVENSIKHALERVSSTITIVVGIQLEASYAVLSVRDNGPGIPADKLEAILESFEAQWEDQEGDNIGLRNLHTRLKLIYGDKAGLDIRTDEEGTEMRMMIPQGGDDSHA
ncbi:sensor histidine kinase [Cohnella sp. AR92]|uniref:cache domain-containing sensor histidine kinase n=1 Tax=Cohnella sp. AR92 TaxID=648716 RepID=UPI000F8D8DF9|nr:sensor histidine kinase [Cohnella sp. AR92]RUS49061.1 sensor histidine kinase [Cohnella sp. AR92]